MRHDIPFPVENDCGFLDYLRACWENGLLDDYSDNHFIIKALENRLNEFNGMYQMMENGLNMFGVIKSNGEINRDAFCLSFCVNLSSRLSQLSQVFNKADIDRFITDQLSAGKKHYNEDTFFEALSEIAVLNFHLSRFHGWTQAEYEPPVTNDSAKNPEAILYGKVRDGNGGMRTFSICIEVKCAQFPSINICQPKIIPTVLLSDEGRKIVPEFCKRHAIRYVNPGLMKLKDFLNSAASKFSIPEGENYNLLYVNWSYRDFSSNSFLEPWSLLTNEINGVLNHPEIAKQFGISDEVFQKVTAVIVYTDALEGIMFSDLRNIWQQNGRGARFRMWILNEDLRKAEATKESDFFYNLTGMKPDGPLTQYLMCDFHTHTMDEKVQSIKTCLELEELIKHNVYQ